MSPETSLYAVCDGMGGHNAGEVASKMAIETISAFVERSAVEKEITWPWGLDANVTFDANRLKTAIRLANARVYQAADNREALAGMGTTVVAALVSGDVLTIGSAGDHHEQRPEQGVEPGEDVGSQNRGDRAARCVVDDVGSPGCRATEGLALVETDRL